jgi:hypothetical protein
LAKRLALHPSSSLHLHRHPSSPRLRRDKSGGQMGGPRPDPPYNLGGRTRKPPSKPLNPADAAWPSDRSPCGRRFRGR